jgi:hypothetical protein
MFASWLNNCSINKLHFILETEEKQYISFIYKNNIYFCDQIDVRSQMSPLKFHFLTTKAKVQFFQSDAPDFYVNRHINLINMRLSTIFETQK